MQGVCYNTLLININKECVLFLSNFRSISSETSDRAVVELQQQLHEKDMKLTDIRLEALSSAHQMEQLRDTMNRMKVNSFQTWKYKRYGGGVFFLSVSTSIKCRKEH